MFFYKVEGHMPKLSSFGRGKTIQPKKSLTSFLHAALQLEVAGSHVAEIFLCSTCPWASSMQKDLPIRI